MTHTSDRELVIRLLANDMSAFDFIYSRYHGSLYAYIIRYLKIPELAEDKLQEVFIRIWEIRHGINPELSFQAYLYRITRNIVFKQLKKIASEDEVLTRIVYEIKQHAEEADARLQWKQYEEILKDAIGQLPPQRQKIFKLCRLEGKTYEEVASELQISRNTVKEHMVLSGRFLKEFIYHQYKIDLIVLLSLVTHSLNNHQ